MISARVPAPRRERKGGCIFLSPEATRFRGKTGAKLPSEGGLKSGAGPIVATRTPRQEPRRSGSTGVQRVWERGFQASFSKHGAVNAEAICSSKRQLGFPVSWTVRYATRSSSSTRFRGVRDTTLPRTELLSRQADARSGLKRLLLTDTPREKLTRRIKVDELKDQVRRRVAAERFAWRAQRATTFISDKVLSPAQERVYERTLALLEVWMRSPQAHPQRSDSTGSR